MSESSFICIYIEVIQNVKKKFRSEFFEIIKNYVQAQLATTCKSLIMFSCGFS